MLYYTASQVRHFKNYLLIFVLAIGISNCAKDEGITIEKYSNIDTALHPYMALFEAEGKARGLSINIESAQIKGEIAEIEEKNVAGQCSYNANPNNREKTLRIDKTYWLNASTLEREFVVFHELGHCYLDRGHREDKDASGNCLSIMQSGLGSCRFRYNSFNRKAYLDELFE